MNGKKTKNIGGEVYEGKSLMNLLHDFWESGNGERLVALPSMNNNVPGLFDDYRPFIEDEDDDDCDCDFCDDDEEMYECICPSCGDKIMLGENIIADGSIDCPNCGEKLEFDFDDVDDE